MRTTEIYGVDRIEISPIKRMSDGKLHLLKLEVTHGPATEQICLYANDRLNLKVREKTTPPA
jgi:hypothetical protein